MASCPKCGKYPIRNKYCTHCGPTTGPRLAALAVVVALTGCSVGKPVVDLENVPDASKYQADLAFCEWLAESNPKGGHLSGAALGGATATGGAVLFGDKGASLGLSTGEYYGASALGGIIGGLMVAEMQETRAAEELIVKCLEGRGYNVLAVR